jgi:hypothetical protein
LPLGLHAQQRTEPLWPSSLLSIAHAAWPAIPCTGVASVSGC